MYEYGENRRQAGCHAHLRRYAAHIWDAPCFVLLAGPMLVRSRLPPWLALNMSFAFLTEIVLG
jgi:hypothetical protein